MGKSREKGIIMVIQSNIKETPRSSDSNRVGWRNKDPVGREP